MHLKLLIVCIYFILNTNAAKPFSGTSFRNNFATNNGTRSSGNSFGISSVNINKPNKPVISISAEKATLSNLIGKTSFTNTSSQTIKRQSVYNTFNNVTSTFHNPKPSSKPTLRPPAYNPNFAPSSSPTTNVFHNPKANFEPTLRPLAYNPNFTRASSPTTSVFLNSKPNFEATLRTPAYDPNFIRESSPTTSLFLNSKPNSEPTLRSPAYNPHFIRASSPTTIVFDNLKLNSESTLRSPAYDPNFIWTPSPTTNAFLNSKSNSEATLRQPAHNPSSLRTSSSTTNVFHNTKPSSEPLLKQPAYNPNFSRTFSPTINVLHNPKPTIDPKMILHGPAYIPHVIGTVRNPMKEKSSKSVNLTTKTVHPNSSLHRNLGHVNPIVKFTPVDLINTFPHYDLNTAYPTKILRNSVLGVKAYNLPAIHRINLYKSQHDLDEALQTKKPFYKQKQFIIIAIITFVIVIVLLVSALIQMK